MWWEFFHFERIKTLEDAYDSSIFGAIFEYKYHINSLSPQNDVPPKYVVAIRGTLIKVGTLLRDGYLDGNILFDLHRSSRSKIALDAVQGIVRKADPRNIWLAGHSLSAAIALQTGRDMALDGYNLETYLFNPPYASIPIELLHNRHLKNGTRIAKSVVTAGLSLAFKLAKNKNNAHDECDLFTTLRSWIPKLFVNLKDPICCEYSGYFEHREKMERWGVGGIERIATKNSVVNFLTGALWKDGEALHLIPSALVTKNVKNMQDGPLGAHALCQWWEQHPYWQSKLYQY